MTSLTTVMGKSGSEQLSQTERDELEKSARKRINVAVRHLIARFPTFAMLLIEKLTFVTDWKFPTCWVNGRHLGFNPQWLETKTLEHVVFVVCHEILHCVLWHTLRRGNRIHALWNMACDFVVNAILVTEYIGKMPDGALYDERFNGLNAYQVYDILLKEIEQELPPPGDDPGKEEGDGREEPRRTDIEDKAKEKFKGQEDITGEVHDTPNEEAEQEQEEEKLEPEEGEDVEFSKLEYDYDPDDTPLDDLTTQEEQSSWEEAFTRAITVASKTCGDGSISLNKLVKEAKRPPVDVVEELTDFMTQPARHDPDWMRPRRRLLAIDPTFWFPGKGGTQCGDLVTGLDESGSVSDWEHSRLCSIQTDILERHPADDIKLWIVHFDSSVSCVEMFTKKDLPIVYERKSCGGTNFQCVVNWINRKTDDDDLFNPECLVFLTDMYAGAPCEQDYPMLWVSTVHHHKENIRDFPGDKLFFPAR